MSIHNELVTVYGDTHPVELAQALWVVKHDIADFYSDWDTSDLKMGFQEYHSWIVTASIMNIQIANDKLNQYQLEEMLENASKAASRCAEQIDDYDMHIIEYNDGPMSEYQHERRETLRLRYEEKHSEISYWAAKVYS